MRGEGETDIPISPPIPSHPLTVTPAFIAGVQRRRARWRKHSIHDLPFVVLGLDPRTRDAAPTQRAVQPRARREIADGRVKPGHDEGEGTREGKR